jgi:hypothetical protein
MVVSPLNRLCSRRKRTTTQWLLNRLEYRAMNYFSRHIGKRWQDVPLFWSTASLEVRIRPPLFKTRLRERVRVDRAKE